MNPREQPEVGGLGKKVERCKPEVQSPDEEVAPGVFKGKDGKFYTAIPKNEQASVTQIDWSIVIQ